MKASNIFTAIFVAVCMLSCNSKTKSPTKQVNVIYDSKPDIIIYSGNCVKYKLDIVPPNHIHRDELGHAFAKLVINRTTKHMNFYFDDVLIFSTDNLLSEVDDIKGGESFDGDNGASAYRLIAERTFTIRYDNPFERANTNDIGYEYLISNYIKN
jgi:hypothetical protein